jgi:hypothetical protein
VNAPSPRGPIPSWLVVAVVVMVATVWFISSAARFLDPDRYPIPAEVHYLMGLVLSMVGGAAIALPKRSTPVPPPPTPPEAPRALDQ